MTLMLLGEILGNLPVEFQKIIEKLSEHSANEFIFVSVLYNLFESGFLLCHSNLENFNTWDFNKQAIKTTAELPLNDIYTVENAENDYSYSAKLRIGAAGSPEVTLIGYPSSNSVSQFLALNFYGKHPSCLVSHCLKTADFIFKKSGKYVFKDLRKLSLLVKGQLAVPLKDNLMLFQYNSCLPHLQRLPSHIYTKIYNLLSCSDQIKLKQALKPSTRKLVTSKPEGVLL